MIILVQLPDRQLQQDGPNFQLNIQLRFQNRDYLGIFTLRFTSK